MIDIDLVRSHTPAVKNWVHFNNAGAALSPTVVLNTVYDYLKLEQEIGGYEAAEQQQTSIHEFYQNAAELIGAKPDEIAYIESATRAWDMAFYSIPFQDGDEILTGRSEYISNYMSMLHLQKKYHLEIKVIPDDEHGQIDLNALEKAISSKTKLVAITHIPTSNGLINPAQAVGKIAQAHDVLYLLDSCQSLGQTPIDVKSISCDFLCATGRKYLRGPRGTGFLYIRKELIPKLEPPFVGYHAGDWSEQNSYQLRENAQRFENWEVSVACKLGLSSAISYCNQLGIEQIEKRISKLSKILRASLLELPGLKVHDRGQKKSGIVTFSGPFDCEKINKYLRDHKINTSISYLEQARLDLQPLGLDKLCRASVHYYNTEEEIQQLITTLKRLQVLNL